MKRKHLNLAALILSTALCTQLGVSTFAVSSFDPVFYAATYPDIAAAYGNDEGAMLLHYLQYGADEGRQPSADGIPGDDTLEITDEQLAKIWTPVPLKKLANYKSLKCKMTDAEFEAAYNAALEFVAPLCLMSREMQLEYITSGLREMFDTQMTYSMGAKHYNDPYGYFVLHTASCSGCARAVGLCLNILGIPYEHVNEGKYSHQWCRVNIDGTYWIADPYGLYCGPEPAPYQHPYLS